jgi:transcriptional regulator with XRE-family HTH domain
VLYPRYILALTLCRIKGKISYNVRRRQRRPTLEALRRARVDAGLTISELAKRAGVSRDTISHAERGRHSLQGPTLSKIAHALGTVPSALLAEEEKLSPKAPRRSSLEPSFNDVLDEERRLYYLKPWAGYINTLANNVEREIDQGHVTDLNWSQEFNRDVLTLTFLYDRILPPPENQTENERLELLKLSEAIDRLNQVADKMDRAMEPVIAEMHKEMYAKERERRKAALEIIRGRLSA